MDELDLLYSLWNKSSVEMCGKDYVFFQNRIPEMWAPQLIFEVNIPNG